MKYLFRARYPGNDPKERNIRVCDSPEEAKTYCRNAQKAADEIYDCEDKPEGWEREDWLDKWQTFFSKQHDEKVDHICAEEGVVRRGQDGSAEGERYREVYLRAASTVGLNCNIYDPLMWYYSGLNRPSYYVEELPG